jgi:hypothetical protein
VRTAGAGEGQRRLAIPDQDTGCSQEIWGKGVVTRYDGNNITVLFDEPGEKVLAVDFAMEHELLARAPYGRVRARWSRIMTMEGQSFYVCVSSTTKADCVGRLVF